MEHIDAIPSSRPVNPNLSVVVAFTLILSCSSEQIFERLTISCSLYLLILGFSHMIVKSMLDNFNFLCLACVIDQFKKITE